MGKILTGNTKLGIINFVTFAGGSGSKFANAVPEYRTLNGVCSMKVDLSELFDNPGRAQDFSGEVDLADVKRHGDRLFEGLSGSPGARRTARGSSALAIRRISCSARYAIGVLRRCRARSIWNSRTRRFYP